MTERDAWGEDPQVRYMRRIFAAIEDAQRDFLRAVGVSLMDDRLRRFRGVALTFFERCWVTAMNRGIRTDERSAAAVYLYCLARAMSMKGIVIPEEALPGDRELKKLVDEVFA